GWRGLGEFIVSADGSRIACAPSRRASSESVQVYLLGQALSFALAKSGVEPLHGSAIEHEGEAIAFVGGSGYGKSTLAASFIAAGCTLLTDDLLVLKSDARGVDAFPGPARIKLFPEAAAFTLGPGADGFRMNARAGKRVIAIPETQRCHRPIPL